MILIAGLFAFQAERYAPDTEFIQGGYSSDTAIPVLMANGADFKPFDFYYWGQDRFGSWPFLLYRLGGLSTDLRFSPFQLYLGMYLLMHLSILLYSWKKGPGLLLSILLLLHFWKGISTFLFDLAQPYGWQLSMVFLAFASIDGIGRSSGGWLKNLRLVAFLLFSFLGIWLSPATILYLLPFAALQTLLQRPPSLSVQGWKVLATPIIAYGLHSLLRRWVVSYNSDSYFQSYETPLKWERKWIEAALQQIHGQILTPIESVLWIVIPGAALAILLMHKSKRSTLPAQFMAPLAMIGGSALFVAALLPLNWFAANEFGARYVALPRFFLMLGAILLILYVPALARIEAIRMVRNSRILLPLTLLAASAGIAFSLPPPSTSAAYLEKQQAAWRLQATFPGVPVLGNYWETYVYTSLQSIPSLPQPGIAQYQRTPFLVPEFLQADRILVIHAGYERSLKDDRPVSSFRFRGQDYTLDKAWALRVPPASLYLQRQGQP